MKCDVCGGQILDPDGVHLPSDCIRVLKERLQKEPREAVKAERRRMSESIEALPNREEIRKLLYPNSEPAKAKKARVISFAELVIKP